MRERGPAPGCLRVGKWAHIVDAHPEPQCRRQGLARRLMTILAWCRDSEVDHVTLGASPQGLSLYESLGFKPTSQMKLVR